MTSNRIYKYPIYIAIAIISVTYRKSQEILFEASQAILSFKKIKYNIHLINFIERYMYSVGNTCNLQDQIRIEVGNPNDCPSSLKTEGRCEFAIKLMNDLTEGAYVLYIVYNIYIFF